MGSVSFSRKYLAAGRIDRYLVVRGVAVSHRRIRELTRRFNLLAACSV
jgi:hypothetical protein